METTINSDFLSLSESDKKKVLDLIEKLKSEKNIKKKKKDRIPGLLKGKIHMKDNFDDPIEAFKDYMKWRVYGKLWRI
ncbi:type II toxin-antitoxin system VapB family antitoxin [Marivirga sp.]|uniref:type II toxin-antitoxin system VapB family antitoxin n=1 Tax=Marivirga sp. TaxID=2018662 RepID=UPI003DA7918F